MKTAVLVSLPWFTLEYSAHPSSGGFAVGTEGWLSQADFDTVLPDLQKKVSEETLERVLPAMKAKITDFTSGAE